MSWTKTMDTDRTVEWARSDEYATIRCRERTDGRYVVRLDRLIQAPEGELYRRETADDQEEAHDIVESWKEEYDVEA